MALDQALVVDEYVIEREAMPCRYVARLAVRYQRDQFAAALGVADAFLKARYANVVRTGCNGSPNGDQITVWFWSSGRRLTASEQSVQDNDPRRI